MGLVSASSHNLPCDPKNELFENRFAPVCLVLSQRQKKAVLPIVILDY